MINERLYNLLIRGVLFFVCCSLVAFPKLYLNLFRKIMINKIKISKKCLYIYVKFSTSKCSLSFIEFHFYNFPICIFGL